MTMLLKSLS